MQKKVFEAKPFEPLLRTNGWTVAGPEQSQRFDRLLESDGRMNQNEEIFITLGPMMAYKFVKVQNLQYKSRRGILLKAKSGSEDFNLNAWKSTVMVDKYRVEGRFCLSIPSVMLKISQNSMCLVFS